MFNLKNFKASLETDRYLKTNQFMVSVSVPQVVQGVFTANQNNAGSVGGNGGIENLLKFRAEQVKAPGLTMLTSQVNRYGIGVQQQFPFSVAYTDNTITFLSDGRGFIWSFWYLWLRSIFGFAGDDNFTSQAGRSFNSLPSYQLEYKDNYATKIQVTVFDPEGHEVQKINMYDAYPISINDVQLGWGNSNQLLKVTVGLTFKEMTIEGAGLNAGTTGQRTGTIRPSLTAVATPPAFTQLNTPSNQIFGR